MVEASEGAPDLEKEAQVAEAEQIVQKISTNLEMILREIRSDAPMGDSGPTGSRRRERLVVGLKRIAQETAGNGLYFA